MEFCRESAHIRTDGRVGVTNAHRTLVQFPGETSAEAGPGVAE